jgi:hypothetical protein
MSKKRPLNSSDVYIGGEERAGGKGGTPGLETTFISHIYFL